MPVSVLTEQDFTPLPYEDARKRFAAKTPMTADRFEALRVEQRRMAFRIATVHRAAMVQWARESLKTAIEEGKTFAEFRELLAVELTKRKLPQPALHRLRLAYHQNTMQAYSDARRAVLDDPEISGAFPYRQYLTVGNGTPGVRNVREDHAVLHGKIFRWDDGFWDRFTPPWDFGCRCTFVALTAGQVGRKTLWTYKGGRVQAVSDQRAKPFRLRTNPNYASSKRGDLLARLDADLRRAIEGVIG